MRTSRQLLGDISAEKSDVDIMKALRLDRDTLQRMRHGQAFLIEDHAPLVADWLELDVLYVVACLRAERAKQRGTKTVWERIARGSVVN